MKITICGSIAFYDEMLETKTALEKLGHEVKLPPIEVPGPDGKLIPVKEYYRIRKEAGNDVAWVWDRKADAIKNHFEKEKWADAVLILNCTKNDIVGYIGGNTLMEMGVAFYLKKPIYLMYVVPEISYKEEILGMKPIVINSQLSMIL